MSFPKWEREGLGACRRLGLHKPTLDYECEAAGDPNHLRCQELGHAPGSLHGLTCIRDPLVIQFPNSQVHLVNSYINLKDVTLKSPPLSSFPLLLQPDSVMTPTVPIALICPSKGHIAHCGTTTVTAQPMSFTVFLISGTLLCWSHKFYSGSGNSDLDRCFLSEKSFVRLEALILRDRTGGYWMDPSAIHASATSLRPTSWKSGTVVFTCCPSLAL